MTPFPLGQHDYDGTLRVPEKLYGRAAAREAILEAVRGAKRRASARARRRAGGRGQVGLGPRGSPRDCARPPVWCRESSTSSAEALPHPALAHACSELVVVFTRLFSSASQLEDWRRRLRLALGDNARVIVDVVPELVVALGEQPRSPRCHRTRRKPASSARFDASWKLAPAKKRRWCSSSTTYSGPIRPLAVLELVLSADSQGHLLVIASYRDSEVDATHPLARMLERLERTVAIKRIQLEALSLADVRERAAQTPCATHRKSSREPASSPGKTSGNPFFIGQFLERLAAVGYLKFEAGRGYKLGPRSDRRARSDGQRGRSRGRAPRYPRAAHAGAAAASGCVGHTFRLRTLSVIAEDEASAVFPRCSLP